jgi:hypothetical protein
MSLPVASELRRYWHMKCAISLRAYIVTGPSSRDEGLRELQVDGIANHRGFKSEVMQRSLWCDCSQVIRESSTTVLTALHFPDQYLAIRKLVIPDHTIRPLHAEGLNAFHYRPFEHFPVVSAIKSRWPRGPYHNTQGPNKSYVAC